MTVDRVRAAWALVLNKPPGEGLRALQLAGGDPSVWATIDPAGHRGLLVALPDHGSFLATVVESPDGEELIRTSRFPFVSAGQAIEAASLVCLDDGLIDAFEGLCETWIGRCQAGQDVQEAFDESKRDFRRLLRMDGQPNSAPQLVGVLGELLVLEEALSVAPASLRFWAFPEAERHDFRHHNVALEVKTSARAAAHQASAHISSVDQLVAPANGHLFLRWIRLDRNPGGDVSVSALTDRITDLLPAAERSDFLNKLDRAGVNALDVTRSYSVAEQRAYLVAAGFPRVVPSDFERQALPVGVGRLTYDIELSAAEPFRISPASSISALVDGSWQ